MKKRIFALAFPVLVLAGLLYVSASARSSSHEQRSPGTLVPDQPENWIPFSADLEITVPGNSARPAYHLFGRFYRDQNGSERIETRPEQEPIPGLKTTVVSIKNIPSERFINYSVQAGWISQPMKLPPGGWKPKMVYTSVERPLHTETVEGFDVYRTTGPSGDTWLLAPALNGFALVEQSTKSGHRQVLKNIELAPQPADLFELPPGADVLVSSEPGGIIATQGGEPHASIGGVPSDIRDEVKKRHEQFWLKYPEAKNWRPK